MEWKKPEAKKLSTLSTELNKAIALILEQDKKRLENLLRVMETAANHNTNTKVSK